jgi:hypothetical protein
MSLAYAAQFRAMVGRAGRTFDPRAVDRHPPRTLLTCHDAMSTKGLPSP